MNFSYHQRIGELLFAAITYHPNILYDIIRLSQYSTHPIKIHYIAVRCVFKYLCDTIHDSLHYWRQKLNTTLPIIQSSNLITTMFSFQKLTLYSHTDMSSLIGQEIQNVVALYLV